MGAGGLQEESMKDKSPWRPRIWAKATWEVGGGDVLPKSGAWRGPRMNTLIVKMKEILA